MTGEKNDLHKSEDSIERISICDVIETLREHDLHCQPCSYTLRHRNAILPIF